MAETTVDRDRPEAPIGPGPNPPDLKNRVFADVASVTLQNGKSATVGLEVLRASPHAAAAISVSQLPFGVVASVSPSSLPASKPGSRVTTDETATLKLTAGPYAPAGQTTAHFVCGAAVGVLPVIVHSPYTRINGAPDVAVGASGQTSVTSTLQLVLAAFGSVDAPFNLEIAAGVSGQITFAVAGLPSGVTAQFTPATLTAAQGSYAIEAKLTAGAHVTPWSGQITVQVSVAGSLRGSAVFPLRIVAPSVSGVLPSSGTVPMLGAAGTTVTVDGYGFGPGTTVAFGADNPVTAASVAGDGTSLTVRVPRTGASGQLAVVSPAGQASGAAPFAVDNYRNTRGFSWVNDTTFQDLVGGSWSFSDAVALFGFSATHWSAFGISVDNPFVYPFLAAADLLLDSGGQCYGMSLASLRFRAGQQSMAGLPTLPASSEPSGPAGPDVWLLEGPVGPGGSDVSPSLASFVHQQHLAQLSQENIDNWLGFHLNVHSAADLRASLLSAFSAGGRNMGALVCIQNSLTEGHCVVAYDIVDHANGAFDILIYNPNIPFGSAEDGSASDRAMVAAANLIQVSGNGQWTLPHSDMSFGPGTADWSGGISDITVVPWTTIPVEPSLPYLEMALLALVVVGDAEVTQVSDGAGHTLLAGGAWNTDPKTQLPGVRPMPVFGGLGLKRPPAIVGRTSAPLLTTITGTGAGSYNAVWLGGSSAVKLVNVPAGEGAVDTVRIAPNSLDFAAGGEKEVNVEVTGVGAQSKLPRTGTIATKVADAASISFAFDPATESFSYTHAGAPASYTLRLSTVGSDGKPLSFTAKPTLARPGQTLSFKPDWAHLRSGAAGTVDVHEPGETPVTHRL